MTASGVLEFLLPGIQRISEQIKKDEKKENEKSDAMKWLYVTFLMFCGFTVPIIVLMYVGVPLFLWVVYEISYTTLPFSQLLKACAVSAFTAFVGTILAYIFRPRN